MAKNELLESRDDRHERRPNDLAVFGGLKGIIRLEKALREGEGAAEAIAAGKMGLGKKGSFANWLKAQDLTSAGKSSDRVWNETGWFQHPIDKEWRMEIPDIYANFDFDKFVEMTDANARWKAADNWRADKSQFFEKAFKEKGIEVTPMFPHRGLQLGDYLDSLAKEAGKGEWKWVKKVSEEADARFGKSGPGPIETTLSDVLDHPELFKLYPELRGVKVDRETNPLYNGSFDSERNMLALKPAAEYGTPGSGPLSTSLHEAQHGIQAIEGRELGINPSAISDEFVSGMDDFFDKATPSQLSDDDFLKALAEFEEDPKFMGYRRAIGEAEARNAQQRLKIIQAGGNPARYNPLSTMDIPANAQFKLNELLYGFSQ